MTSFRPVRPASASHPIAVPRRLALALRLVLVLVLVLVLLAVPFLLSRTLMLPAAS